MLPERFKTKYAEDPRTSCWIWHTTGNRYGNFWNGQKTVKAHRFAYESLVGPIPEGQELDHLCRNTLCVNPDHLEPVSHQENVTRGDLGKARREQTHCKRGHPLTGPDAKVYLRKGIRTCNPCKRVLEAERRADPIWAAKRRAWRKEHEATG